MKVEIDGISYVPKDTRSGRVEIGEIVRVTSTVRSMARTAVLSKYGIVHNYSYKNGQFGVRFPGFRLGHTLDGALSDPEGQWLYAEELEAVNDWN